MDGALTCHVAMGVVTQTGRRLGCIRYPSPQKCWTG